jgi:hypothetical protein
MLFTYGPNEISSENKTVRLQIKTDNILEGKCMSWVGVSFAHVSNKKVFTCSVNEVSSSCPKIQFKLSKIYSIYIYIYFLNFLRQ